MSLHDDISWDLLRRIVRSWAGDAAELDEVRPLVGGCINATLLLHIKSGERTVLKVSPHRVNREFQREAHQLGVLREIGLPAPRVYRVHTADLDNPDSYLLMEYLPGVPLNVARQQCSPQQYDQIQEHLAELVARMHSITRVSYGRVDGGSEPTFDNWVSFYRHVYDPIIRSIEQNQSIPARQWKTVRRIHDKLDRLLAHDDQPRLVHWDIWSTNVLAAPDENDRWRVTAILDPNSKFAHREAEIAYLDLFQTSTPAFRKAYQQQFRLDDDYHRVRKPIYQLYPMLNHVQLFGSEYLKPFSTALERAAALA